MKRSLISVFACFTALTACTSSESSTGEAAVAAVDSLRALDQQLQDAVNRKDLERIASFYDDSALFLPAAEPLIRGKEAIRAEWAHTLAIPGFQNESKLLTADISASGDLAYTTGTYSSVMVGQDGGMVREPGKWLSVWKRRGGEWRIVVDTYNTDVPPPDHK